MELFRRRPLCFFCFLFLTTSALIFNIEYEAKLILIFWGLALILVIALLFTVSKKYRIVFLSILLCMCAVLGALANSALRIDYPHIRAREYIGDRDAQMSVLSVEYTAENTSTYTVKIKELDKQSVSVKALLVCGFATDLSVGDTVYANVELVDMSERILGMTGAERTDDSAVVLTAVLYNEEGATVERLNRDGGFFEKLFSKNGFTVVAQEIKRAVKLHIDSVLGEETGALAKGFLLGDKSDIETNVIRDFRRSGVSHLFAVSGLHISILLGAVEMFLKKLFVPKSFRCVIVTVLSFILLFLTGFSMSALRSVFMLWIVYVIFLFSEESDSPTTLFLAVSMIIAIFPYAVGELGMWMSFLATLGLVTVYPLAENLIRKMPKGRGIASGILKILKPILLTILMTVISNMFLLPIQWKIFGELSVVSIPANVILSPLSAVFLIASTISLFFSNIPIISSIAVMTVKAVGHMITWTVESFSSFEVATVSLKYYFTDVLVIAFTVAIIVMLVIKLRHKWIIALPFLCFTVVFGVSAVAFELSAPKEITYYSQSTNETFAVTSGRSLGIVDMSNGSYSRFSQAIYGAADNGATDVDYIVFTTVSKGHISSMEYFFRSNIVNRIYIPEPQSDEERELAITMATLANESNVDSYLYGNGEILSLDGVSMCFYNTRNGREDAVAMFISAGDEIFGYTDANIYRSDCEAYVDAILSKCNTVIIGNNGVPDELYSFSVDFDADIVYASEDLMKKSNIFVNYQNCYYSDLPKTELTFELK